MSLTELVTAGAFAVVFTAIGLALGWKAGEQFGERGATNRTKRFMLGVIDHFLKNAPEARIKWKNHWRELEARVEQAGKGTEQDRGRLIDEFKSSGIIRD